VTAESIHRLSFLGVEMSSSDSSPEGTTERRKWIVRLSMINTQGWPDHVFVCVYV
jgi:hypothetical protein